METLGVVFLGVIAVSSAIQAIFLIRLGLEGKKLGQRLEQIERRFETELQPSLRNLAKVSQNVAEVAEIVALQSRRVDLFMADTIDKMEDATGVLRQVMMRPMSALLDITALLKGVRKGVEIYRRLGGMESEHRGGARRYADDEHLFI
jgi:hypothetical protein